MTLLLTGCSAKDWERNLRFGWPTGVTKQGERMRVLWTWSGVAALAVGVLMWGLIFWCCIRYRKRNDDLPRQTKYNLPLEIAYSIIPFLIIAGLFWRTVVVENYTDKLTANPDVVIQVDAFKWNWQFEYHKYKDDAGNEQAATYPGQTDHAAADTAKDPNANVGKRCDEAAGNQSELCEKEGLQAQDANTPLYLSTVGSDSEIPVLVLPVDQTIRVVEHSEDVIHSFWVPEFLFKRDVIPFGTTSTARDNQFEFTATSTGSFVGRCAELCGTYHSQMNFEVRVVDAATFDKYLAALKAIGPDDAARQSKALIQAGLKPYATTTKPFNTSRVQGEAAGQPGGS
ncbi:MAG TPA: cytochrome c oxidase subunit II [Jatrophihabitantaceae bacterium]|nr:cytochrome c oxidase subunit II [Jatrophihabitantaceae bacterium]